MNKNNNKKKPKTLIRNAVKIMGMGRNKLEKENLFSLFFGFIFKYFPFFGVGCWDMIWGSVIVPFYGSRSCPV